MNRSDFQTDFKGWPCFPVQLQSPLKLCKDKKLEKFWKSERYRTILEKVAKFLEKMGKSQKNFKWRAENWGKFEEKLENFEKTWKISEKLGQFEGENLRKTSNGDERIWGNLRKNWKILI